MGHMLRFAVRFLATCTLLASLLIGLKTIADVPDRMWTGEGPQISIGRHLIVNHPLHLLLTDPSHAAHGWFLINNRDILPADASLEAYDTSGALLLVDHFDVAGEGSHRVAWADLPAGTASVVLTSTHSYADAGLYVSIARESPMIFGESPSRDLHLPPTANINETDILLYNPSEQTANVDLRGETTTSEILWPHELRTVAPISGEDGIHVSANQQIVVATSAPITDQYLSFREPIAQVLVSSDCEFKGACAGSSTNLHVGRDYSAIPNSFNTSTSAFAVNFGKLKGSIRYDQAVGCNSLSCGMGNVIVIEHLLISGERWLSLNAHLSTNLLLGTQIDGPIVKGQQIGIVGCSGSTIEEWCRSDGSNRHLHFELKKPDLGTSNLWPFGYMNQTEANSLKIAGDPTNLPITTAIDRSFTTIPTLQGQSARVLLPYFSRSSSATPSASNYDVYGTAGSTLYSALPLRPSSQKTFTNVGVGGYSSDSTTNSFICATAILTSTSAPLTRSSSACNQATGSTSFAANDYKFFASSNEFGRGYEVKFSVLPANSEIIDNDGRLVDATGNITTANRVGYFASSEAGALDVPGYFLSAKLFTAGGSHWARWFPADSRTYEVWVHVPKGATATSVRYKVYPKGRPADDSCSTSNAANPCYQTDVISHSSNQDRWVRLAAAGVNQFSFVASSTNSGHVELVGTSIAGGTGGADAVKFIATTTPAAPSGLTATAASTSQINLSWVDNSNNETGFYIERKTGAGGTYAQIGSVGAGVRTYASAGLTAGTTYYYRVRAYNGSGNSGYSNEANATTSTGGGCTSSTTAISVGTTASGSLATTDCQSTVRTGRYYDNFTFAATAGTAYTIDMTSSFDNYLFLLNSAGTQLAANDDYSGSNARIVYTPTVSGTLTIHATSYSTGATGSYSVSLSGGTTPTVPTAPTGVSASDGTYSDRVRVTWGASSGAASYEVWRHTSSASSSATRIATGQAGTTYDDTGAAAGTTYYYWAKACNNAGCSGFSSADSGYRSASSALPDLVILSMTGPTQGTRGQTISVSTQTKNQGSGNAAGFRVGIYFSTNSTINTSDTRFGYCDHSNGLAAGGTVTCSGSLTVPATLSAGTYYLGAIADYSGTISESNESNNTRASSSTITLR